MKNRITALAALMLCAAAFSANAQYGESYGSHGHSGSSQEIDWAEKELFAVLGVHGLAWNALFGGGATFGLEYVNSSAHVGIGARTGISGFAGTDDDWDVKDMAWDNDVFIPIRVTDELTLYGGVGVTLHDCKYSGLVQSESYSRNARSWKYTYSLKTVHYSHGGCADTTYWFGGLRWRTADNLFFFGEYRRTAGTLELSTGELSTYSKYKDLEADFDGNYFAVGMGWLF